MTFDIGDTLAPKSDQLDAVDLLGGPQTFTITDVTKGNAEQPVDVHLAGFPRVWRPGKSMRRVLAHCWGTDASQWKGRRVTLYCDEAVMFGGETVGGTRISHLSHIDKRKSIPLLIKRGKSAAFTVNPLAAEAPPEEQAEPPITQPQMAKMQALFGGFDIKDREDKLGIARRLIGRDVTSAKELTAAEASKVIDALQAVDDAEGDAFDSWYTKLVSGDTTPQDTA
jgi:hypothetical protein